MNSLKKCLKTGLTSLILILVVLAVNQNQQADAASSLAWKQCGEVHYFHREYLTVEGSQLTCSKALGIARDFVKTSNSGKCERDNYCEVKGFACPLRPNPSKSITCHSEAARVRLKAAPRKRLANSLH
jgi:hypothetical protein